MSVPTRDTVALHPDEAVGSPYAVLRWLVVAAFVVILNETVMVNAIPRLMVQFEVSESAAQWLSTAFMLTMAVVIPATGWFLQRFTTRQAFAAAMGTFIAGTVLAAAAPTFGVLIAARVVQASGTAVMIPLLMTTLMTIVPAHDRGRVMGNVTLAISVAPALGPTVAGVVLQVASWRWLFLVMLPIAVAIAVVSLRKLTDVGETKPGSLDVPSLVLAALGFGSLVFGLSALGPEASSPVPPWMLIVAGLAVVGGFAWRQQSRVRHPNGPLLDLRTLAYATYSKAIVLQAFAFLTLMGAMILLPLTLQDLRGLSPLATGLLVAPAGLAMGLAGPRVGRAYDRVGARPLMVPGSIAVVVGLAGLSLLAASGPLPLVVGAHLVLMIGLACLMTPAFTLGLGALPQPLYSHGSSLLGTAQQVAAALGTAVSILVLSARSASLSAGGASPDDAYAGGVAWAFGAAAVLGLITIALAVSMPNRPSSDAEHSAGAPVAAH
ncbi:multidrug efflux MFS transporter [Nocardioidaceae bacterium]|nr:multidrug efflux MFS transporter [Nocardioidaceae bacterium]